MRSSLTEKEFSFGTDLVPPEIDKVDQLGEIIPLRDGDRISISPDSNIEAIYLGGHTPNHMVFADHVSRCVFTGDAIGSGWVVGIDFHEGSFAQTYTWYRENLDRFIHHMEPLGYYTYFGGHFIQENSCEDRWQEDYLNGHSRYFVPLSLDVAKDMRELCNRLLAGEYAEEANPDVNVFFIRLRRAALNGRKRVVEK